MRRYVCVVVFMLFSYAAPADEKLTDAKRSDIYKLLEVTGAASIGQQMSQVTVQQLTDAIKRARPDVPTEMLDIVREEVNKTIADAMVAKGGFVDVVTPIYHKHFTHQEVKGLLSFYQSTLGKKTISVLPALMQESMVAGQRWGQALGPIIQERVRQRFKDKGVESPI